MPLITRRLFVTSSVLVASTAMAEVYPTRPITLIVPGGAGGAVDTVARIFAGHLGAELGQPVVVDDRPGAGGNIGTAAVARAPRDGYTLLMAASSVMTINPSLYKALSFDPVKDFDPVGTIATAPHVLVVNSQVPVKNVQEFIALAKTRPGSLNYASVGNGSLNHLLAEMFKRTAGVDLSHVPYKTAGAAISDTVSGQVQANFASLTVALPLIKSGQLRALGLVTRNRSPLAPGVPTLGESVPGFEATAWYGLMVAAGTPRPIKDRLRVATEAVMQKKELASQLGLQGLEMFQSTPSELSAAIREETTLWNGVVLNSGARLD